MELKSVVAAERLSLAQLEGDLREMQGELQKAQLTTKGLAAVGGDAQPQADSMAALCAQLTKEVEALAKKLAELGGDSKELLKQYGEDGKSATLEGLCGTINEFRSQWQEGCEKLRKLEESREKAAKKRAAAKAGGGAAAGGGKKAPAGARAMPGMGAMMGELGGALAARGTAK